MANSYNYERFDNKVYGPIPFALHSPKIGECATDFTARRFDGSAVRLSDFKGKRIVLETGSMTCPMFGGNIDPMNRVADRYADDPNTVFLLLYTREAHPAPKFPAHRDDAHKLETARLVEPLLAQNRIVMIDDVVGTAHRQWGEFPNSLWLIDEEGIVRYRSDWNHVDVLETLLEANDLDAEVAKLGEHNMPNFKPTKIFPWLWEKSGWLSIWDMIKQLPWMRTRHQEVHRMYDGIQYMEGSNGRAGSCF
ncbi:peroxiredoxin family protein [Alterisphingorhabdus coralli]|uniref:Deiodinase-like protein n=1 Tax=Alterisphingorhabdus coralli TaxID=3071408 RepID=A0AA97F7G1_9SPHN|nr:deiodinase-like protein [Parasphingorhabdus sp. SCSIO 66989]WOE74663.1 deiodinase-like protein [Parasphingorhabdus sp. SCSIO 66989]